MAKQPFISHAVNGYSRYDLPESKAFSCTPGILYPVRIDFINARDRVTIDQGIDVRSNPLGVPCFNPYTIRLHRFWVPMQLYHPEMRVNSSNFDMNSLSLNWLPRAYLSNHAEGIFSTKLKTAVSNSLMAWLRCVGAQIGAPSSDTTGIYYSRNLPPAAPERFWFNADPYLAYWDIVRNYYSYSQWGLYSYAWPGAFEPVITGSPSVIDNTLVGLQSPKTSCYFNQRYCNLEFLDYYYENAFYPASVANASGTYNRSDLFWMLVMSDLVANPMASDGVGPSVSPSAIPMVSGKLLGSTGPGSQTGTVFTGPALSSFMIFSQLHPMAVVPSSADRFSRLLPPNGTGNSQDVVFSNLTTIPQLAIASRLQEYRDLLGAGGSRYSDFLETFFASKIEHVDRPKLLFAASAMVNVQVVMSQTGAPYLSDNSGFEYYLGQQGGAIAFNSQLGRRQSYYFREPGYMIDMLSIRPVYYWSGISPDWVNYKGADYFNPIYNDTGYQDVGKFRFFGSPSPSSSSADLVVAREPCYNEFRSTYDEVLGALASIYGQVTPSILSSWVQQRAFNSASSVYEFLFTDITSVNLPFSTDLQDNFFVNLSYSVVKKNLVNKTFATRLSNR